MENLVKFLSNSNNLLSYYTHCTLTLDRNISVKSKEDFSALLNKLRLSNSLDNKDTKHSINLYHKKILTSLFPRNDFISLVDLIDSLIVLIDKMKNYHSADLDSPYKNIDQYVAETIRYLLFLSTQNKSKDKCGIYSDRLRKSFRERGKIKSAKYLLNHFKYDFTTIFNDNNCYLGLLSNTTFTEIKEQLSGKSSEFVTLNHHQHSITNFIVFFKDGVGPKYHAFVRTFLCMFEFIIWRMSFFQLFFRLHGPTKKFHKKEDVINMYRNVINLKSIIQLSTQSEFEVNYRNGYGILSAFESGKKHILISDNSIEKLGLNGIYCFKASRFEISNYNGKVKYPASFLTDKHLKLVRTFRTDLLGSMNLGKGHDSSYLITRFRLRLAKIILQLIQRDYGEKQLVDYLEKLKKIIFNQIDDIHLRISCLALTNSMKRSIYYFPRNEKRTSLEKEMINRIDGLTDKLISKKRNLKESWVAYDIGRKHKFKENLEKLNSLFSTV